jgi:hypothetical protein
MRSLRRTSRSAALLLALAAAPLAAQEADPATVLLPGDAALRPSRVRVGADTFRISFANDSRDVPAGSLVLATTRRQEDGVALLVRVETTRYGMRPSTVDSFAVSAETLAPRWAAGVGGDAAQSLRWDGMRVRGSVRLDGQKVQVDTRTESGVFHDNATDLLLASLPLAEGWRGTWPVFDRGEALDAWVQAVVTTAEAVTLTDGTSAYAWRVEVREDDTDPSTYWIARDDGRLLRFASAPMQGMRVVITR